MKKYFLSITVTFLMNFALYAQTTIILQPGSVNGNDAFVWDYNPNTNYGSDDRLDITAWTANGTPYISRAFIQFDLHEIPVCANIISAHLSLYHNNTTTNYNGIHSGANESFIERITSAWQENTLTWNNQPSTSANNRVNLPATTSGTQDFLNIDVKNLVINMINNPSSSFGFMMRLQTEVQYRDLLFASSDHANPALHPKLEITYETMVSCLTLQPDSINGKDAFVFDYFPNSNYGSDYRLDITAWTSGGTPYISRAFVQFDLNAIPAGATIEGAWLSLYHNNNPANYNGLHNGANASVIQRVTSTWQENTITWNNQPSTTAINQLNLPATISGTEDFVDMDVKNLVTDMLNNPATSFGFMMRLETEQQYRNVTFLASENSLSDIRPKLIILYNCIPNAQISAGGPTIFCSGGSVILNANTGAGLAYQWKKGVNTIPGATNSSYAATTTGNYTVVVTNICGSATSSATTVTVNSLPNATITAGGPTTFCSGGSVVLNAVVAANRTYQWKKNNTNISGATLSSYSATGTGNYKVTVTNTQTGCSKTTAVATAVTVNAKPAATITPQGPTTFCAGGSVVLAANTGTGLTYKWKKGSSFISGATLSNYTATSAGTYRVEVTNSNGCTKLSAGVTVTVPCKEGESESESTFDVKVFPNPNSGEFTITFSHELSSPVQIELTDALGNVVRKFETADETVAIKESNLAKGIYCLTVRNKGEVMIKKISVTE